MTSSEGTNTETVAVGSCHCGQQLGHRGAHVGSKQHRQSPRNSRSCLDLGTYGALFYGRKVDTGEPWSLSEIGRIMGVTREAVRCIRKKHFPHLGSIRDETKPITRAKNADKRFLKLHLFRREVRSWLAAEGYFQCGECRMVKCEETDRVKGNNGRCRTCNREQVAVWRENGGAAKQLEWKHNNPDKTLTHQRRYNAKIAALNPGAMRCASCQRVVGPQSFRPNRVRWHKTLEGQACDGHKLPGLPL